MMTSLLYLLVPLIAFLYASVGFGGATGYLAAMSFFGIPPQEMASTALVLNILVSSISFSSFYRAGHLRRDLLLPFLVTSVPAAFLGGYFKITDETYSIILYIVLTFVAVRLLFFSTRRDVETETNLNRQLPSANYLIGLIIGLLSGMVGIGGGIFLSPIIIFARWGTSKHASAVAAAFIALNSISGLIGRAAGGTFIITSFGLSLIPFGLLGALAGSYLGAVRINGLNLRRTLGVIMSFAVSNFWLTLWR
ncbi:MAG: sulfite exporter TauE/SafE family protein [Anaerolineaceae bacterium]|jgi:hypothetical protein|nr:MAG: sulfite exporter TauE/SafE family protein [Anaerolineaceae bacterium]